LSRQYHDVHGVLSARHAIQQRFHVDPLRIDVGYVLDLRIDWNQVVAPRELRAVPGKIKEAYPFLLRELAAERADRFDHVGARGVQFQSHFETHALQVLGHRLRIVRCVFERHLAIFAVADNQRQARNGVDRRQRVGCGKFPHRRHRKDGHKSALRDFFQGRDHDGTASTRMRRLKADVVDTGLNHSIAVPAALPAGRDAVA
jgi:hypothetical protein